MNKEYTLPRVLVVDDSKDTCRIFSSVLKKEGYEVSIAYDGFEALKNILHSRPDLILLDLMMPRMDGFEVCRTIKSSSYRSIPVLILTVRVDENSKTKSLNAGADEFMTKPVKLRNLLIKIRSYFDKTLPPSNAA